MVYTRASSRAASAIPESTPPPTESSSTPSPVSASASALPPPPATPSTSRRRAVAKQPSTTTRKRTTRSSAAKSAAADAHVASWSHTPTTLTLLWLTISLPLVIWDTVYMLGRPHTFEGGSMHWPLWVPYRLYATIDHVYSPKAWDAKNGFSGAQSAMNAVETTVYFIYLYLIWSRSEAPVNGSARKTLPGRNGALAVLIGFGGAIMTLSKTLLYFAHEYYSGFDNIGHNSAIDIITLWLLPNGPWIVFSAYMVWSFGKDILDLGSSSSLSKED